MWLDLKLTNGINLYREDKKHACKILQKFKWQRASKRFYQKFAKR